MPLSDVVAAALSRPAARVVEGPVRTIVNEVLADHGYASPAQVQSLRDEIGGLHKTVKALESRLASLESKLTDLETKAAAPPVAAAPTPAPAAPAPAPAEVITGALPSGAEHLSRADRQLWKAGRLPGHVGPEGLVEVDGKPYRVDLAHAGRPYEVTGKSRKSVRIAGKAVKKTAL